jgi:hypothetical protein
MNSMHHPSLALALPVIATLLIGSCTHDAAVANNGGTTETTSANIVGKLWNQNGSSAKTAIVKLISMDYNPYLATGGAIDSTFTDNNGTYAFKVRTSGFFNISAQSGAAYCFVDSVFGSEKVQNRVKDDTLKAPGSIAGVASVRPGDDCRLTIILVLGTNRFSTPLDSTGAFFIPNLAEGTYSLRILTAKNGYGFIDTSATVISAETTAIRGVLKVPYNLVPEIGPVSASYDMPTMIATLTWPAFDTSDVESLYVFRNTGVAGTPIASLSKKATSFDDDVLMLDPDSLKFHDTLRYCVAACARNRTIGKAGAAPDIVLRNFLKPTASFPLTWQLDASETHFAVAGNNTIFITMADSILKVDETGKILARYIDTSGNPDRILINFASITVDEKSNVYVDQMFRDHSVLRLSPDLKLIDTSAKPGWVLGTTKTGLLCYSSNNQQDTAYFQVYDSTFRLLKSGMIPERGLVPFLSVINDTIYFIPYSGRSTMQIATYDLDFKKVRTWNDSAVIIQNGPGFLKENFLLAMGYQCGQVLMAESNGNLMYLLTMYHNSKKFQYICYLGPDKKVLGKCMLDGDIIKADASKRIYSLNLKNRLMSMYTIRE